MLLLLFGSALIVAGVIVRGNQLKSLVNLKTAFGKLYGYETDAVTGEFHAIVSFSYNTDKYFFRNSNTYKIPRDVIGSEQTVYLDPAKSVELPGSPVKATLRYNAKLNLLPWILMATGVYSVWLFSQLAGLYFFFILFVVVFTLFFGWAQSNFFFANFLKNFGDDASSRYPLSESFPEEKLEPLKFLDPNSLRTYSDQWLAKQNMKGFVFVVLATLCLAFTNFSTLFESDKVQVEAEKKVSIEEYLDGGPAKKADGDQYCIWFESDSCYFSYLALAPHETEKLIDRFTNLLVVDTGFLFIFLALICFYARKIFTQHEAPKTTVKV